MVRIGGEDRTAHALIQDGNETYSCELTRDLAKALAPHLYTHVRLFGRGRWVRMPQGRWALQHFRATHYERLTDESLSTIAGRLRELPIQRGVVSVDDVLKLRRD